MYIFNLDTTNNLKNVTSLPDNLTVNGELYLYNTPISKKYTKEQLKQMLPGVKGKIFA
jgi:hypothetical protein